MCRARCRRCAFDDVGAGSATTGREQVIKLARLRYGPIELPRDLSAGKWREASDKDIAQLIG